MRKFQNIASNVENITGSLKSVVDGEKRRYQRYYSSNFNHAAATFSQYSLMLWNVQLLTMNNI